jgi:hypothetical protein
MTCDKVANINIERSEITPNSRVARVNATTAADANTPIFDSISKGIDSVSLLNFTQHTSMNVLDTPLSLLIIHNI